MQKFSSADIAICLSCERAHAGGLPPHDRKLKGVEMEAGFERMLRHRRLTGFICPDSVLCIAILPSLQSLFKRITISGQSSYAL